MSMQPYNIEIFDPSFNLIQHYNSGAIEYKYDYLSTVENSVLVAFDENVEKGDYIRIVNDTDDYFGYITAIQVNESVQGFSEIRFKPFISLFDAPIMFDTTLQGSVISLEQAIADIITAYWISNSDTAQNIFGLEVETSSVTSGWGFHITSDQKDLNKAIINFMSSIIRRSLTKYQVGLYAVPDFEAKKIKVTIGKMAASTYYIEADLPNVIEKSVIINETTEDMNKLVIYDQADLVTNIIYYKHPDGSYDTVNTNRIVPVIYGMTSVASNEEETFADAAQDAADKQFDVDSFNNLIELTVQNDDELVNPNVIAIGQAVNVITNGASYSSILTGVERGIKTKLIFGSIRLDLTQILKKGGY